MTHDDDEESLWTLAKPDLTTLAEFISEAFNMRTRAFDTKNDFHLKMKMKMKMHDFLLPSPSH